MDMILEREPRTVRVTILLTQSECDALKRRAFIERETLNSVIRRQLRPILEETIKPAPR